MKEYIEEKKKKNIHPEDREQDSERGNGILYSPQWPAEGYGDPSHVQN